MLEEQIRADLITAMKTGQTLRVSVLRMALSEVSYKKIDVQRELTDEDVIAVIAKETKKRREAIEAYKMANRPESAAKEQEELEILNAYLPKMMSEEEVRKEISEGKYLEGVSDFGQAMKIVAPKFRGRADGSTAAKVVKEMLG